MAVVKWSGMITDVKGKLNGSVFQTGSYGNIIRSNHYRPGFNSIRAYKSRSSFNYVQAFNSQFTLSQVSAFQALAITLTRATKGGSATPYNWWTLAQHVNNNLFAIDQPLISAPFTVPVIPDISPVSVSNVAPATYFTVSWSAPAGSHCKYMLFVGSPVSGKSPFARSACKLITVGDLDDGSVVVPSADVSSIFGNCDFAVARWFYIKIVHASSGWSAPLVPFFFAP